MADFKLNYIHSEDLKQEYIRRKELTYSEKLLIEDFFNWLFKWGIKMNSIFTLPSYPYAEPNLTIICIMIFLAVVYIICQLTRKPKF